jgi:putative ABC transport system permease protein
MKDRIAASFAQTRATMLLLAVTAALAAALAGVAIYGSIWYSVSQRIPEFGVRLALGASRASIGASVMRHAATLSALGGALGIAATAAAGPLLSGLLFNTRPIDAPTYAVVAGVLAALTIAATVVPARRAMTVDPIAALRSE